MSQVLLQQVTAADVMTRHPIVFTTHTPLREAARLLLQTFISGAPVVDHSGRCVGILSSMDFVRLVWPTDKRLFRCGDSIKEAVHTTAPPAEGTGRDYSLPPILEWQIVDEKLPAEGTVASLMTSDPVTMVETASIAEVARTMLITHVHRIVIVDFDHRPVGIVSGSDLLNALASRLTPSELETPPVPVS